LLNSSWAVGAGPVCLQGRVCTLLAVRRAHGCGHSRRESAISGFDDLRADGQLGPECLKLIYHLIREESCRFLVLMLGDKWQQADLEDLLGGSWPIASRR
jgi:hypothetical protein